MTVYYKSRRLQIRTALFLDIKSMKDNLRKEEIDELYASHHWTPEEGLSNSFSSSSSSLVATIDGKPFAMFGIVPDSLLGRTAQVWLLTTNDIPKIKMRFLKMSKLVIRFFLIQYPILYNYVDARHKLSIEWLKWCGAILNPAQAFGLEQVPFHFFTFNDERRIS